MIEERLDDSDEQRIKLFKDWLHQCPHGEFHTISATTWEDEATLGFSVDFAITKRGVDDA